MVAFRSLHLVSNVKKLVVHFFLSPLDRLMRETRHSAGETTGLLPRIRETGAFKSLEESKKNATTNDGDNKSSNNARKFQFVCMGNVNAAKTRVVISEKNVPHEKWSTTVLKQAPTDVAKKVEEIAHKQQLRTKKMLTMSSKDFTFDVKSQITRTIKKLDASSVKDQLVSDMPLHQFRFDDQIFSLMTLILTLFNHGSAFDADQLVNMILPFSTNPEREGRICIIQPSKGHIPYILDILRYVYAMSRRVNRLLNDRDDGHMDSAQGLTLFKVMNKFNTSTGKHRNEMFKLLFDKKTGSLGGIYEDMKRFKQIYPKAESTFEKAFAELCV